MSNRRLAPLAASALAVCLIAGEAPTSGQALPNPFRAVEHWATFADSRIMGAVGDVTVDNDGSHIWAVVRCDATAPDRFGNECLQ